MSVKSMAERLFELGYARNLLNTRSLAATVDSIENALDLGILMRPYDRLEALRWVASRQGVRHSYAGLPAPTDMDLKGIKVFTGETISTRAGICHILGEEALRLLLRFDVKDASVKQAIDNASASMIKRLGRPEAGTYCCGKCSVALWRTLLVGGLDNQEARLANGLKSLKEHRDGKGRWGRYPFYYALSALNDIYMPAAVDEMRYAAPILERMRPGRDKYSLRRQKLAKFVLARC